VLALVACGGSEPADRGEPARLIDGTQGIYRDVALGDGADALASVFGDRAAASGEEPATPLGWGFDRNDFGPPLIRFSRSTSYSESWYRYEDAVFFMRNEEVGAFLVVDERARSKEEVQIGDPLDEVKAAY
jgi:hypothetical protein